MATPKNYEDTTDPENSVYSRTWENNISGARVKIHANTKSVIRAGRDGATKGTTQSIARRLQNQELARKVAVKYMKLNPRGKRPSITIFPSQRNNQKKWVVKVSDTHIETYGLVRTRNLHYAGNGPREYVEYWFDNKEKAVDFYRNRL